MCVSAVLGGVKQVTAATVTGACVSPCESWRKTGCLPVGKKNGLAGMKTIEPEVQVPPGCTRHLVEVPGPGLAPKRVCSWDFVSIPKGPGTQPREETQRTSLISPHSSLKH